MYNNSASGLNPQHHRDSEENGYTALRGGCNPESPADHQPAAGGPAQSALLLPALSSVSGNQLGWDRVLFASFVALARAQACIACSRHTIFLYIASTLCA